MANNYSLFSEMITGLTEKEVEWIRLFLTGVEDWECEGPGLNPDDDDFEEKQLADWLEFHDADGLTDVDVWPGFQWAIETSTAKNSDEETVLVTQNLWLYAEEAFDVDKLIHVVTRFHKKFRPKGVFQMTWADYCSKPRIGEFGGGAVVIYGDVVDWNTAYGDSVEMLEHLKEPWKNDRLQFARLISEIRATQDFTSWTDLCSSMDLDPEQVDELFDRAHDVWEEAKP